MDPIYAWLQYIPKLTPNYAKALLILTKTASTKLIVFRLAVSRKSWWIMWDNVIKGKQLLTYTSGKVHAQLSTDTPMKCCIISKYYASLTQLLNAPKAGVRKKHINLHITARRNSIFKQETTPLFNGTVKSNKATF
tara:strand:+ start:6630 stop:7037 length:408 start_codon:yes stop_codon:yes gene_type:complete